MNWLSELQKRGVVRVGAAYIVTSWLLVQVADTIFPAFDAPDWAMRALIIGLAIGLPIALTLSWVFDLTSQGWVRAGEFKDDQATRQHRNQVMNTVIIAVLAAAVVLFALDRFVWNTRSGPTEATDQVVGVLPFSDLGTADQPDSLAAGIHDDLLTQLSKMDAFRTVSRTSVLRYADTLQPIPDIAREIGATAIVEGGVQRAGDRVRINAQLIDSASDTHLWAETFDRELTAENIFAIQSDIARAIASALQATLSPEDEQLLGAVPTSDTAAYEAYAAGRAAQQTAGNSGEERAVAEFQRAVERDPGFAAAWAGLCEAQLTRFRRNSEPAIFESAEAACNRALELDDTRAEVHLALGSLYREFGQYARAEVSLQRAHYAKAEAALEQALTLDPLQLGAMIEMGKVLSRQDRLAEAERTFLAALEWAPDDFELQMAMFSFYYARSDRPDRFERAVHHASRAAALRPDLATAWNNLGTALFMLNQYDEAADAWRHSLELEPTRTAYTNTGLAYYNAGQFELAIEMQLRATELAPRDHRPWGRLGDAGRFIQPPRDDWRDAYVRAAELAGEQLGINPRDWRTRGLRATYLAHLGQHEAAEAEVEQALQDSDRRAEVLFYSALVAVAAERLEACLDRLEEAVSRDADYRHLIANDPDLQALTGRPRFQAITGS